MRTAGLLGKPLDSISQGRMSYDLRRLTLHGHIAKIKGSHRYRLTDQGIQVAMFFTRTYARILRPGMAQLPGPGWEDTTPLRRSCDQPLKQIDKLVSDGSLAA